jgi:RNA polymerase-binding transcription factor DksA
MSEKTRYSDEELAEFKELIQDKLKTARQDYQMYTNANTHGDENGTENPKDSGERSQACISKDEAVRLAQHQLRFVQCLESALVRIENKTYGICRETGKLIDKERLRAVPHATLSIEAKILQG